MYGLNQKHKKHNGPLYAVTYSERHKLLFTGGSDKIVAAWDLEKGENVPLSIKTESAILNFQLLNDDKHLFIGLFNGDFYVIDIDSRKEVIYSSDHKLGVFCSCYIKKRNMLFVGSGDGKLTIWDVAKNTLLQIHQFGKGKIRAIHNVDENVFIGNSEGEIFQINIFNLSSSDLFAEIQYPIFCLNSNVNNDVLLVGDKNAHLSGIDILTKTVIQSIPAHNWPIYKIEWLNPDEFATCSRDKIIKIWDAKSFKVKQRLCFPEFAGHINSVNNLVSIPSIKSVVSIGDDKQICLWKKR